MTPERLVVVAVAISIAGSFLSLAITRSRTVAGWFAFLVTSVTAALVGTAALHVLMRGPSGRPEVLLSAPGLGFALRVSVDGLTAIFLILAVVIGVPASLNSIAYMRRYAGYGIGHYYPHMLFFMAAMYGLVSTTDMMWFLFIFWQMMTIPGYLLIRFEHREPANIRAANRFLAMMQLGCAATMIGAEILASEGTRHGAAGAGLKYSFDVVTANLPRMLAEHPALTAVAFGLFLVGFGVKTGMWPFGAFWLPDAHPAAPTPVSAVLSGVMIKTGVYGMLRYFLCLVPLEARADYPLATWGAVVALIGTATLVTGTATALRQDLAKRLLAYHSIGQVGYILLAVGICMAMLGERDASAARVAALALVGVLLHSFNHGVFKALLFLNAGSMLHATETQDLTKMGGLWRCMPVTAVTALTASLAISGFPLLNGFVSKWTIYVSALAARSYAPYIAICGALALFTSALTLASFVKFFGASFLGRTSEVVAEHLEGRRSLEVGWLMQLPQLALAAVCIVTGVVPAWLVWMAQRSLADTRQGIAAILADAAPLTGEAAAGVHLSVSGTGFAPVALLIACAACIALAWGVSRAGAAQRRSASPWLCGYARDDEHARYSAHGFYGEVKRQLSGTEKGLKHDRA